jgi:hypothetical protein
MEQHAVIIYFDYNKEGLAPLHELEDKLEAVLVGKEDIGEYDGHEIAVDLSDGVLYLYGPNAEALFKAIKPTLQSTDFMKGSLAKLRFGEVDSDAKEIEVEV